MRGHANPRSRLVTKSALPALLLACTAALPAAAQGWTSSYTRHHYDKCPKRPSSEADGVTIRACRGAAGIAVIWTAGDDSSAVGLGAKPTDETIVEASFFEAGTTIEWLGPRGGKPEAAILRYRTGQRIGRLAGSRLVIYRIGKDGTSCILGSVDGGRSGANLAARRLAEETAPAFRCGQDRRIDR